MAKTKIYKSATGAEIPSKFLRKVDKQRHEAAQRYYDKALKLQDQILKFKKELTEHCDKLQAAYMADYNVKLNENARGGFTMSTLDKEIQIEFSVGSRMQFDDRIDAAKIRFFDYIDEVTSGTVPELRQIVETAFQTSRGKLDPKKILQLLQLKIEHPTWKQATDLLTQSMSSNITKRYITIRKKDAEGKYENVVLDFNAL